MPLGDIFRLGVGVNQDGEKCSQVLHYEQGGPDGALPPEQALFNAWTGTMLPLWRAVMSVNAAVETITIQKLPTAGSGSLIFLVDEEGDVTGDAVPPNATVLLSLYTSLVSRRGRGRTHFSGYPESAHSDGIINAEFYGKFQAIGTALVDTLPGSGGEPGFRCVVWSSLSGAHDVEAVAVRTQLHTLRGRRMASRIT